MGKIPYLFRRRNIYYFRIRVPAEHQQALNATEIVRSLKTESRHEAIPLALQLAANVALAFNELKPGTICDFSALEMTSQVPQNLVPAKISPITVRQNLLKAPLLSVVVDDFLNRYDPKNKPTLTKLKSTLPVFVELIGDKPINTILQTDVNNYFDQVQKLPVRRDAKVPLHEIHQTETVLKLDRFFFMTPSPVRSRRSLDYQATRKLLRVMGNQVTLCYMSATSTLIQSSLEKAIYSKLA